MNIEEINSKLDQLLGTNIITEEWPTNTGGDMFCTKLIKFTDSNHKFLLSISYKLFTLFHKNDNVNLIIDRFYKFVVRYFLDTMTCSSIKSLIDENNNYKNKFINFHKAFGDDYKKIVLIESSYEILSNFISIERQNNRIEDVNKKIIDFEKFKSQKIEII